MTKTRRVSSVSARILFSYVVVLVVLVGALSWSVLALRAAARDTALLQEGYLPLALSLRDLVALQDTWNSQLNHVTATTNPADKRVWFDTATSVGRPRAFSRVETLLESSRRSSDRAFGRTFAELGGDLAVVRARTERDRALVGELFEALGRRDHALAESKRDQLVVGGLRIQRELRALEGRVNEHVTDISRTAERRERFALQLLVAFAALTVLTGVFMALYARRVLRPLSVVTSRAQAVARGDLEARPPLRAGDELGELSVTFERMVGAIAEAREKLLASERLAAIGKMAAHVTHEVRNPLSSIALNLELLEDELPESSSEARALLKAIGQEVQRLGALSNQYLSMARGKAPEFESASVPLVVEAAVEFMRRDLERGEVMVRVEAATDLPAVQLDPAQLRQALFNLLRNAREAMPSGGTVWVRSELDGDAVRIDVDDDGPGVPLERVASLFDPFFTTKNHGTGLGLAVTRQIVLAHGGRLDYAPRPGGGSRFSLRLPLEPPEVEA